jgi:S1-C subfamily serine protease
MIGINSQILSPAGGSVGVGFAVPVNTAKRVVPQLIQFGAVNRPNIGANGVGIEKLAQRGVDFPVAKGLVLYNIANGGPAYAAGLRGLSRGADGEVVIGDIVTAIDGTAIGDLDDLYRYLDKKQVGDTVQVQVYRGGTTATVPVRLTASPTSTGRTTRRIQ